MSNVLISGIKHPYYAANINDWNKWRLVYNGGTAYVDTYLQRFTDREEKSDFDQRKRITPTPNFAKSAVNDVKNSIFQRLTEVARRGGSKTYQDAMRGEDYGVDLDGSSMNTFIGRDIIIELLIMSRVGIFVDMPVIKGTTQRDAAGVQPYLYRYLAEDILSWQEVRGRPDEFQSVLLRDHVETISAYGLPSSTVDRYRLMFIDENDGRVHVRFYTQEPPTEAMAAAYKAALDDPSKKVLKEWQVDIDGNPTSTDTILDINSIPFVLVELSDSLLADVANHQIALLNMESSDVNYSLRSNFPFYVEQDKGMKYSEYAKGPANDIDSESGSTALANTSQDKEIQVGATRGRRYAGDQAPEYIHPSPEPLKASMEKQLALKQDIRSLINLSLSTISPKMASAESKQLDDRGLDAGLSNIGLELEAAERKIARFWHMLENPVKSDVWSVKYPEKWSLKSDSERREDAKSLRELRETIPSSVFQRAISKEIVRALLGHKLPQENLDKMFGEIDKADSYTADPETVFRGQELGLLEAKTAAQLLGWPEDGPEKAAVQHAERAARIVAAQAKAVPDGSGNTLDPSPGQSGKDQKVASGDPVTGDKNQRGDGKAEAQL